VISVAAIAGASDAVNQTAAAAAAENADNAFIDNDVGDKQLLWTNRSIQRVVCAASASGHQVQYTARRCFHGERCKILLQNRVGISSRRLRCEDWH